MIHDSFRAARCQMYREREEMGKMREELVRERQRAAKLEEELYVCNNSRVKAEEQVESMAEEGQYDEYKYVGLVRIGNISIM